MVLRYKKVFRSDEGKHILSDLMDVCGLNRSSFSTDPIQMAFYEGQRSVILRILKTVNITEKELDNWFALKEKELEDLLETEEQL